MYHRLYENLGRGYLVQDEEARQLHSLAGVPEGPCGVEELQKFQQALGSQYQLLVMCRSKPFFLIFINRWHLIKSVYSNRINIMMSAPRFRPLSTEPIIV